MLMGAARAGAPVDLFTSYIDGEKPAGLNVNSVLPDFLKILPWSLSRHLTTSRVQRRFLEAIGDDEIAYLWPSTGLNVYEALAARGVTIASEMVNTRMAVAKPLLDAAYEGLGLEPGHGITDARIDEQNARHAMCTAIFAPSPAVEASFAGSSYSTRIVPTSYGTWVPEVLKPRPMRAEDAPVVFLFVGRLCVRKGAHLLLEAWRNAPKGAILRIVGEIEPAMRKLFADVLDSPGVSCAGFMHDVALEYQRADVALLPSLEEGDPIATYEAAAYGVPVIASAFGGGRISSETGAINVVDQLNVECLRDCISEFAASEELRQNWGAAARNASLAYDWNTVAPNNIRRLYDFLEYQVGS
ncbi:glycosyltransferase family 4 protein [Defluviimonas aestuarii]|uniref:glycosyltransferase family 4 protein n=1 Tax=Albidovulum aestuarii TaxID=1130726 RepID=UPI002499BD44|nr:glycosyltransferase family 4 protein [Defluviimonas aestuarii]MDI3338683.1 glycosyltransferase family 4 protein [Defluviimonas aestuarii]